MIRNNLGAAARCAIGVALAIGLTACGGSDDQVATNPLSAEEVAAQEQIDRVQEEIDTVPLCEDVLSGEEPLPSDGKCREIPSCEEVASGEVEDVPEGGDCIDPAKLVE